MASAVSSYAPYKMHPESDANGTDAFNYEGYSTYTATNAPTATTSSSSKKQQSADANDRSLTISTNAPMAPPTKKTSKSAKSSEPSEGSVSDSESSFQANGEGRADHLKPRLCTVPGCKKRVRSKGLCKAHGGGRRCMVEGCERSSQGQGLCIRHGGGKRCTQPGCTKASQSNGLCKAHGGGLRCMAGNCTKSSQGGGFCRAHGGGQRCEKEGCNKGAQRGGFCAGHGGSRFCQHPDCTKNDRGGGYCAEHGGGKRCDQQGCNKPARKKGKCSYHANANKQKTPKDAAAAAAVPPPMMDMRQITAPTAAYGMGAGMPQAPKDEPHPAMRSYPPVSSYQPRVDMDQRYSKGYDQPLPMGAPHSASNPYMAVHPDQRSYEPMGMPQVNPRHYMDASSLPSVSSGYSAPHKPHPSASMAGMDRSASPYNPAARHAHPSHMGHPQQHAYSQHWSSKDPAQQQQPNAMPDRGAGMDYFDMKDQNASHHAYGNASASYGHHHHQMSESAYANQRENYYQQQQQPPANDAQGGSNMMYGSYGYQSHQMHNMSLL